MGLSPTIVRIEVEHMKHALSVAMADYVGKLDLDIKAAIERVCTAENILGIIQREADQAINQVIKKEVEEFFWLGEGRGAIRDAVQARLKLEMKRRKKAQR